MLSSQKSGNISGKFRKSLQLSSSALHYSTVYCVSNELRENGDSLLHGNINKEELTYAQNGKASSITNFAVAHYSRGKLPPVNLNRISLIF